MTAAKRNIEVDEATATALETRAAEQGRTVAELLADLAAAVSDPIAADAAAIAELDRRWADVEAGDTVSHDAVTAWLETWGTPAFGPGPRR